MTITLTNPTFRRVIERNSVSVSDAEQAVRGWIAERGEEIRQVLRGA